MFTKAQFAKMIDSTLVRAESTKDQVIKLCADARKYHFASVVVFPCWVPLAVRALADSDVKVCTVVGFPYGANARSSKVHEAKTAIAMGASEIDLVMNISAMKSGDYDYVATDIADVVETCRIAGMTDNGKNTLVKVIIETCYLTDQEKVTAAEIIRDAGADFIKTSTGTGPGGATVADIRLLRRTVGPDMGVKAAGGIRDVESALAMLDAGANRIGTSAAVALITNYNPEDYEVK